ncbi:MAG TPA: hypothetical protein VK400_11315 [Pyrinomonadaceae bacterium]|nr:hypothetical protein [Pyrinomonadaceae bacterium]
MERLFQILAVILAGIAAFFLWRGNWDAGFISAVFGAVCFFLSVRFQIKGRLDVREAERQRREEEEELAAEDARSSLEEENETADLREINADLKHNEQHKTG